jgi:uncharacterized protein (DUF111 family)
MRVELDVPVPVPSAANLRQHWMKKADHVKKARLATRAYLNTIQEKLKPPLMVQFVRAGPRTMDFDNLAYAFKAHQDAAAKWLGVDDAETDKVRFTHTQTKSKKQSFTIIITEKTEGSMNARFTRLDLDRMVEHIRKVPDEHLDSEVKQALEDLVMAQPEYDAIGHSVDQAANRSIPAVK